MSPDGSFFYANLTPVSSPAQSEFIYGGQTVNPSFYQATGATRILAFNVQPDVALRSPLPFIRNQAGGNLPNAVVSPYYVVAPANVNFGNNLQGATRTPTLQASLAIDGEGANQQSVIVMQTGQFFIAADGSVAVTGLVRGSSRLDPTAPPVRITSSDANVIDGLGGRIYGKNSISGFVLDQNGYDFNSNYVPNQSASETTLTSPSTITTNYAFNQPVTPGTLPSGVGASRTTQTLTGFFGGLQQNRTAAMRSHASYGRLAARVILLKKSRGGCGSSLKVLPTSISYRGIGYGKRSTAVPASARKNRLSRRKRPIAIPI